MIANDFIENFSWVLSLPKGQTFSVDTVLNILPSNLQCKSLTF